MSKDKNLRFFIWGVKRVVVHVFELLRCLKYSPNWKSVYFCRTLLERVRKQAGCFYLCVMSNAFIFNGFLSMGGICFSIFISKTVGWFKLMYYSFRSVFRNNFGSSWENSLLKKCGCSRCHDILWQVLWLLGKIRELYVTLLDFPLGLIIVANDLFKV